MLARSSVDLSISACGRNCARFATQISEEPINIGMTEGGPDDMGSSYAQSRCQVIDVREQPVVDIGAQPQPIDALLFSDGVHL
jgi:hypothetical protein